MNMAVPELDCLSEKKDEKHKYIIKPLQQMKHVVTKLFLATQKVSSWYRIVCSATKQESKFLKSCILEAYKQQKCTWLYPLTISKPFRFISSIPHTANREVIYVHVHFSKNVTTSEKSCNISGLVRYWHSYLGLYNFSTSHISRPSGIS